VSWLRCQKNFWTTVLGLVVIQLYAGECTRSVDRAFISNIIQLVLCSTWEIFLTAIASLFNFVVHLSYKQTASVDYIIDRPNQIIVFFPVICLKIAESSVSFFSKLFD